VTACARCGRPLAGRWAFSIGGGRDLWCALRYGSLVRRSLVIALIVGTLLTIINQLGGDANASLAWRVPLTYAVPFCVATLGALVNSRMP
jgi:hypothetical protein